MRDYADAVIGVPGEGLNVLQRKKLTVLPQSSLTNKFRLVLRWLQNPHVSRRVFNIDSSAPVL